MRYYLIAGEASGDLHASNLMMALKKKDASAEFRFYGGEKMEAVGGTLVKHYRELAYMGFIPVLLHLRTILSNMSRCKKDIAAWQPDIVILVDYPGFNLDIARFVHQWREKENRDTKVYYYISPKIWAWKEYRIKAIRRDVDELFSILPFEVEWFAKRGYDIHYVGNPCVDAIEGYFANGTPGQDDDHATETKAQGDTIAILAGSRRQEIRDNLGRMLEAARPLKGYRLVLAAAPNIEEAYYRRYIPEGMELEIVYGKTYEVLTHATAALVTSGTATLETAILRIPQVVCYYMNMGRLFSFLRRLLLKVPYISLVNLIAGREVVTELVADGMTVENVRRELERILPGGEGRDRMLNDYEDVNKRLGGTGASERAAEMMLQLFLR